MNKRGKAIGFSAIFFLIIQALICYGLYENNQTVFIYEVIATTLIILVYSFFEIKYNLFLNHYIRILVITTILLHTYVGDYLHFYAKSFVFDKILHGFGTYSFTLFVYVIINQLIKNVNYKRPYEFIFVVCLGMTLGQGLEFLEFLIDLILKPAEHSQSGLIDTNLDMILNTLGAIIAAIHISISRMKFLCKR